eukprot:749483-Hanusia_phi.AAC.5
MEDLTAPKSANFMIPFVDNRQLLDLMSLRQDVRTAQSKFDLVLPVDHTMSVKIVQPLLICRFSACYIPNTNNLHKVSRIDPRNLFIQSSHDVQQGCKAGTTKYQQQHINNKTSTTTHRHVCSEAISLHLPPAQYSMTRCNSLSRISVPR